MGFYLGYNFKKMKYSNKRYKLYYISLDDNFEKVIMYSDDYEEIWHKFDKMREKGKEVELCDIIMCKITDSTFNINSRAGKK